MAPPDAAANVAEQPVQLARVILDELEAIARRREGSPWEENGGDDAQAQAAYERAKQRADAQVPAVPQDAIATAKWQKALAAAWAEEIQRARRDAEKRSLDRFQERSLREEKCCAAAPVAAAPESAAAVPDEAALQRARVRRAKEARRRALAKARHDQEAADRLRLHAECSEAVPTAEATLSGATTADDPLTAARVLARDMDLTGLAFSGGGIRSATFCLGILQGLADLGLLKRMDYLSTVSGGGYIGSWLAAWIKREGSARTVEQQLRTDRIDQAQGRRDDKRPTESEPEPIFHLRSYSNYLAPRLGLFSADGWVLGALYLRNFVLNLLLIVTTLLGVMLVPRLGMLFYDWDLKPWVAPSAYVLLGTIVLTVVYTLCNIQRSLANLIASKSEVPNARRPASNQTNIRRLRTGIVLPLAVSSFLLGWFAWDSSSLAKPKEIGWLSDLSSTVHTKSLGEAVLLVGGIAAGLFFLIYSVMAWTLDWDGRPWRGGWFVLTGIISGFVRGAILGLLMHAASAHMVPEANWNIAWAAFMSAMVVTLGPPAALLVFWIGSVLEIGLMGLYLDNDEREWWGSLSAYVLKLAVIWAAVCGLALFGVPLLILGGAAVQAALGATWLTTAIGGVLAGSSRRTGSEKNASASTTNLLLDRLARVAPYVFVIGLIVALSGLLSVLIDDRPDTVVVQTIVTDQRVPAPPLVQTQVQIWRYWAGLFNTNGTSATAAQMTGGEKSLAQLIGKILAWMAGLGSLAALLSWRIGVNTFSLHSTYGNRLIRCYLGASRPTAPSSARLYEGRPSNVGPPVRRPNPVTGFDPLDDLPLIDLQIEQPLPNAVIQKKAGSERPYRGPCLLVNTALNLVNGEELAWQERKAEAFLLTPLWCGSKGTDYRPAAAYADGISLGNAITISGAAASPNMGYHSSPAVTALLTVFNVRLGAWLGNPQQKKWQNNEPLMSLVLLMKELFGQTNRKSDYVYLSDGGHFENLGIYELVRRQCRFIIAVDADQDGSYSFDDLGGMIRKCRSDLGVPIDINVTPIKPTDGKSRWHCAVGKIRYDCLDQAAVTGTLVYIKTSLTGDEPSDVSNYATENPDFPHQTTADQFFSESQFESYRALGAHVAHAVFDRAMRDVEEMAEMSDAAHRRVVRRLFANLRRDWFPPPPNLHTTYLESVQACIDMEVALRGEKDLARLSRALYPELPPATEGNPANDAAAAEIYAISQMLRVMEVAWLDGSLDGYYDHPLNRGWITTFRRWTNSAIFRKHWLALRGECGPEFVRFCEQALRLDHGRPRAFRLDTLGLARVPGWPLLCAEFGMEWPEETPLDEMAKGATMLAGKQAVWLLTVVPAADPQPETWTDDKYPCGVVILTPAPAARKGYDLLVWVRGAYRNVGIGRECLNDLFPDILDERPPHDRQPLWVRYPGAGRPRSTDKIQKEMWFSFFFEYDFRRPRDLRGDDLLLRLNP